jgi:hypothetical protein
MRFLSDGLNSSGLPLPTCRDWSEMILGVLAALIFVSILKFNSKSDIHERIKKTLHTECGAA